MEPNTESLNLIRNLTDREPNSVKLGKTRSNLRGDEEENGVRKKKKRKQMKAGFLFSLFFLHLVFLFLGKEKKEKESNHSALIRLNQSPAGALLTVGGQSPSRRFGASKVALSTKSLLSFFFSLFLSSFRSLSLSLFAFTSKCKWNQSKCPAGVGGKGVEEVGGCELQHPTPPPSSANENPPAEGLII